MFLCEPAGSGGTWPLRSWVQYLRCRVPLVDTINWSRTGGDADTAGARAHKHTTGTRCAPEGQPDRARGTHRPHGMTYQQARARDTRTGKPATRTARDAREGQQAGDGGGRVPAPAPPRRPAASAAKTPARHCTRQGSSGARRHAPAPRLGSLRAIPRDATSDKPVARTRQCRHPGRPCIRGAS